MRLTGFLEEHPKVWQDVLYMWAAPQKRFCGADVPCTWDTMALELQPQPHACFVSGAAEQQGFVGASGGMRTGHEQLLLYAGAWSVCIELFDCHSMRWSDTIDVA